MINYWLFFSLRLAAFSALFSFKVLVASFLVAFFPASLLLAMMCFFCKMNLHSLE